MKQNSYFYLSLLFILTVFLISPFANQDTTKITDIISDNNIKDWEEKVSEVEADSVIKFMDTTVDVVSEKRISRQYKRDEFTDVLKILKEDRVKLYHYYLNRNKVSARKALRRYARVNKIKEFKEFRKTDEAKRVFKALLNALVLNEYLDTPKFKREKIEDYLTSEEFFLKNKENLDVVRSKYVITPHEQNFLLFHPISGPTGTDSADTNSRISLNWKVSIKFPLFSARTRESGIYLFFTNTGCFDFENVIESQPVSKKSFMPGMFGRFDWEKFRNFGKRLNHIGVDNETDLGFYHHSNGGDTTHDRSRGIAFLPYLNNSFKIIRHAYDSTLYNVYSQHFLLTLNLKAQAYIGKKENEDIGDQWGYVFGQLILEKAIDIKKNNGVQMLFWADLSLSKASQSLGIYLMPVINKLKKQSRFRLPLTWYLKGYHGKDEYLLNYTKNDKWLGFGLMFRK